MSEDTGERPRAQAQRTLERSVRTLGASTGSLQAPPIMRGLRLAYDVRHDLEAGEFTSVAISGVAAERSFFMLTVPAGVVLRGLDLHVNNTLAFLCILPNDVAIGGGTERHIFPSSKVRCLAGNAPAFVPATVPRVFLPTSLGLPSDYQHIHVGPIGREDVQRRVLVAANGDQTALTVTANWLET